MTGAPPLTISAWLRWDSIRRALAEVSPRSVLEVGTGEGAMAWRLGRRYSYLGVEPDPVSAAIAQQRVQGLMDAEVVEGVVSELPETREVDLVCAFEVLEHVEHHVQELAAWAGWLRASGHVLFSVPAHRSRMGPTDRLVGHHRRYDRGDVIDLVDRAGFEMVRLESWGAGLGHLLEFLRHRIASRRLGRAEEAPRDSRAGAGFLQPRGVASAAATALIAAPFRLLQSPLRTTDVGIGWVVLARRRPSMPRGVEAA